MLCHSVHGPVQQARPKGATNSCRVLVSTHYGVHTAANSSSAILLRRQQLDHRVTSTTSGLVFHAAKDGLDAELEATQKTLDKVLQAVQAAQAAQAAQQQPGATANVVNESALVNREQQLWDRQQELMDRMQQQWDRERQAFFAREQQLLSELSQLRKELSTLLLHQATAVTAATAAAVAAQPSVSSSSPAAAAPAAAPAAPAARAAPADAPSAASRPGPSMSPGQATISGPSTASAAVAAAIRAVRDEGVTPTDSTDRQSTDGSWRDLFSSSGDRAVSSVASAIAAVDGGDVLSDLDLTYSSSSSTRGRRRLSDTSSSNGSSSDGDTEAASHTAPSTTGSSPVSAGSSADTGDSSASSGVGAVEVQRGDPEGPPPVLSAGDDDIYWVAKLHDGLLTAGYYPSDDELENWLFSDGTLTALLTFQACNNLPETGVTCEETWRQLMGPDAYEAAYGHLSRQGSSSGSNGSSSGAATVEAVETAYGEVTYSFTASSSSSVSAVTTTSSSSSSSGVQGVGGGWPVVMDMDGGKEVHALQVCLCKAGFNCGDDEMRWWQFGSATMDALKTFQACSGLPESGVCDERTWLALLGPDAKPDDLDEVRGDESMYEEDMGASHEGAVWLLGEQRWSSPSA